MAKNRKPNWLLRSLLGVSLGIHILLFMHIAGLYRSNAITRIELIVRDSKPFTRDIPRPRPRSKAPEKPQAIKEPERTEQVVPQFKPMEIEAPEPVLPNDLVEQINLPAVADNRELKITEWNPGSPAETAEYITSADYFEMVRLRIENHKKYPETARIKSVEGRTTICFVIAPDGQVDRLKVIKRSGNKTLDKAALDAINAAAPFPQPPKHLFSGPISLEIPIAFELN